MALIQLRWSDETVWKALKVADPSVPIEQEFASLHAQFAECKAKYKLNHDIEFRLAP